MSTPLTQIHGQFNPNFCMTRWESEVDVAPYRTVRSFRVHAPSPIIKHALWWLSINLPSRVTPANPPENVHPTRSSMIDSVVSCPRLRNHQAFPATAMIISHKYSFLPLTFAVSYKAALSLRIDSESCNMERVHYVIPSRLRAHCSPLGKAKRGGLRCTAANTLCSAPA